MASIREEIVLERSLQCMRLIQQKRNISTRQLAKHLQISNGAAYYVLNALIEKGYVKAENFKNNPNKSGYLYFLTQAGLSEKALLTAKFIRRKKVEYQELRQEIEALELEYKTKI